MIRPAPIALLLGLMIAAAAAQEPEVGVERPGPPPIDNFDVDANGDTVPDGWYNLRDGRMVPKSDSAPACLRFENRRPGRQARISRAFGIDGRQVEAIVIGLWVRLPEAPHTGERAGDDPNLLIDLLGDRLSTLARGVVGPWAGPACGTGWTRVARRIAVPPGTRDAIMTLGLLGATGVLEVRGLTFDPIPVGGAPTTNLLGNAGFELGTPEPTGWVVEKGARRSFPAGHPTASVLELSGSGALALAPLAVPVDRFANLDVTLAARAVGLRGSGGASSTLFFLDNEGRPLPGFESGAPLVRWSGSHDWRPARASARVPRGAVRAVLQIQKDDAAGSILVDDVVVSASPNPGAGSWTPGHVADDTTGWHPVPASTAIQPGSALDFAPVLGRSIADRGRVAIRDGRLVDARGNRARFFGAAMIPPASFPDPERADALADRLARSGINLVRLGELDAALGPGRSLFDDSRDDTAEFDPLALARLDHFVAALKAKGIAVAVELHASRRFREGDDLDSFGPFPPGGGVASVVEPAVAAKVAAASEALLARVNPETGLALRDDPAVAWITLAGETSLFDLIDEPSSLPAKTAAALKSAIASGTGGPGRRGWQQVEADRRRRLADALCKGGLKAPIAAVSHWRREAEFAAMLAAPGFDLVDDRLFWTPAPWGDPDRKSLLRSRDGGLAAGAARKRKADRPYVVGQWCAQTNGAWALPHEGADLILASMIASNEDWDALVRRGIFTYPVAWGSAATGTGGVEDIFHVAEVINGSPQIYGLWPHAASLFLRGIHAGDEKGRAAKPKRPGVPGWDPARGRLAIDTPFTQGLAGWPDGEPAQSNAITAEVDNPFGVLVATSVGPEPIERARRILVTALGRVEPTGFRWMDQNRREVADPGRPPLLREPIRGRITWRRASGTSLKCYVLDEAGARVAEVPLEAVAGGVRLALDGRSPAIHWELVDE